MSKKDNFSQAMYEMFGLGKAPEEAAEETEGVEVDDLPPAVPDAPAEAVGEQPAVEAAPQAAAPQAAEPERPAQPASERKAERVSAPQAKREDDFFDSFGGRANQPVKRANPTYFAEGTSMEGTIRSDSDIEIAGDFKGEIASNGKVTLHANTTSTIASADLVLVDCNLLGDAVVTGDVSINENSTITGNLRANNVICSGVVNGNLTVQSNVTLTETAQIIGEIRTETLTTSRGAKVSGKIDMGSL